jgi:hypothetical protein
LGILSVLILVALAYLTHRFVDLTLERDSLGSKLDIVTKYNELREYKETVAMAPEEARRILEILDRAIVMSETDESEVGLVGVPEPTETEGETPPDPVVQAALGDMAAETGEPADPAEAAVTPEADPSREPATEAEGDEGDPLQAAWQAWHKATGSVNNPVALDIDDFEVSASGNVTFLLRQDGTPGQRVKGRVLVILALSDPDGKISLVSAPAIDLTKPQQGWELGSKYNIVASKLVRAQAQIPEGAKILNAEVVSWQEETKRLVFRKKILIEDK